MLTLDDIMRDPPYKEMGLFQNHIMHEVKRHGVKKFLELYEPEVENFKNECAYFEYLMLLSIIEYYDNDFIYDPEARFEKYVLDPYVHGMVFEFREYLNEDDSVDLDEEYNNALDSFKRRGILYSELDEAI